MIEFMKEWRAVIVIGVILLIGIAALAGYINMVVESKKAVCYQLAQRFNPPAEWRWNPSGWGNGCEISFNGNWYPADLVQPSLKSP